MAITYPTTLDNLSNPNSNNPLNSPSHAGQHADSNDAIEALEAKVGVNGSAVTTSHDYKIAQLESGKIDKSTLDAASVLGADTDNTPVSIVLPTNSVVGRILGNLVPIPIDSDLSSTSSGDDTVPSAKATKTALDSKQATMTKAAGSDVDTGTDDTKYVTSKAVADSKLSYTDGNETLTNKRINPRLVTATSYTTDTGTSLNIANCDQFEVTAQAGALKFNNPGGTPLGGQKLIIRIKDNGTARALTYDTQFRAMGNALPSTTVLSKTLYMGFIYNATDTKWDLVAVAQEA